MAFSDIPKVESADTLLDIAFRRAASRVSLARAKKTRYRDRLTKSREMEQIRLEVVQDTLCNKLSHILKTFPSTDDCSPFYQQLLKVNLDFPAFKRSLGALNWAIKKIRGFHREYRTKIRKCQELQKISDYRRQYYGRIASILKQIRDELQYLDRCRQVMRGFPTIKELPTVAIVGFPNVGKTTLLYELTGSKAEIASYAFTTKGINVGYLGRGKERIQLLDTPGTLNRFEKMNAIERQAYLSMKLVADALVYVFDPTETYPLETQQRLYASVKKLGKPMMVFVSKTDLVPEGEYRNLVETYDAVISVDALKERIPTLL